MCSASRFGCCMEGCRSGQGDGTLLKIEPLSSSSWPVTMWLTSAGSQHMPNTTSYPFERSVSLCPPTLLSAPNNKTHRDWAETNCAVENFTNRKLEMNTENILGNNFEQSRCIRGDTYRESWLKRSCFLQKLSEVTEIDSLSNPWLFHQKHSQSEFTELQ
jgi:hypothetical protein